MDKIKQTGIKSSLIAATVAVGTAGAIVGLTTTTVFADESDVTPQVIEDQETQTGSAVSVEEAQKNADSAKAEAVGASAAFSDVSS